MKFCVLCNLHFGVSGGFFQGAKLRTLVYAILIYNKMTQFKYIITLIIIVSVNLL